MLGKHSVNSARSPTLVASLNNHTALVCTAWSHISCTFWKLHKLMIQAFPPSVCTGHEYRSLKCAISSLQSAYADPYHPPSLVPAVGGRATRVVAVSATIIEHRVRDLVDSIFCIQKLICWVWKQRSEIPTPGTLRQNDCWECKGSLDYIVRTRRLQQQDLIWKRKKNFSLKKN